jgi:hypothetical protein
MECGTNYKNWNMVFKWISKTLKTQRIISITWGLLFELHKHVGNKAQTKKLETNVESC